MAEQTCAVKIESLLVHLGISQVELASRLSIDQSMISRYLSGKGFPGALVCLMLAGMSENSDDRDYWFRKSGLTSESLCLLQSAIVGPEQEPRRKLTPRDRILIEWFTSKSEDPLEESVKEMVNIIISR